MNSAEKPLILLIDDLPDEVNALALALEAEAEVRVLHPDDLTDRDIAHAGLVLIDYLLEEWPGRDSVPHVSLKPQDGLALAAVIRSRLRDLSPSTSIALHSAHLGSIVQHSPSRRPHIIARAANIEWAFAKGADTSAQVAAMVSLARAANGLKALDASGDRRDVLRRVLNVPSDADWEYEAFADAGSCLPPAYELLHAFGGIALLRWLLQRVLPYPCFLSDLRRVALRLRTTVPWLRNHLQPGEQLWDWLEPTLYGGELDGFLGDRWWRAGLERLLWDATGGAPFSVEALHEILAQVVGSEVEHIGIPDPTIGLGPSLDPLDHFIPFDEAVRIQPDDWPAYAEPAMTTAEEASREPLARLVIEPDRWKLE